MADSLAGHHDVTVPTALSQVNFYMQQHRSQYGFLLTDREFVVFQRLDDGGNLEISRSITFTTISSAENPHLTVLLALWYLGMLAVQDGAGDWLIYGAHIKYKKPASLHNE